MNRQRRHRAREGVGGVHPRSTPQGVYTCRAFNV